MTGRRRWPRRVDPVAVEAKRQRAGMAGTVIVTMILGVSLVLVSGRQWQAGRGDVDLWAWTAALRAGDMGNRLVETALSLLGILLALMLATLFSRGGEGSSIGYQAMTRNFATLTFWTALGFSSLCWGLTLISTQPDPGTWAATFVIAVVAIVCCAASGLFDPTRYRAHTNLAGAAARKRRVAAVRRKLLLNTSTATSTQPRRVRDRFCTPPWKWCGAVGLVLCTCTTFVRTDPIRSLSLSDAPLWFFWFLTFAACAWAAATTAQAITIGVWLREYLMAAASACSAILLWLLVPLPACLALNAHFDGQADLLYIMCVAGPAIAWLITRKLRWPRDYLLRKLIAREQDENRALADARAGIEADRNPVRGDSTLLT